jgi:hypothetical protein
VKPSEGAQSRSITAPQAGTKLTRGEITAQKAKQSASPPASEVLNRERSFPKTLAATGRESGNDRYYAEVTDEQSVAAADKRIAKDPETARQFVLNGEGSSKERVAVGLKLADDLIAEAQKESDPVKAAEKHSQAIDLYGKLASDLTSAGQTVQAASLAKRYSPTGAVLEATRMAQENGKTLTPEDTRTVRELATRHQASESRITELEKQIEELQKQSKPSVRGPRTKISIKLEPLKIRLDNAADQARMRIEETKAKMAAGELQFRNAGPLPGHIATHLSDYATIGAAKLAKGGLTFAQWSAEMVDDLGEEIRPHLDTIYRAAFKQVQDERGAVRGAQAERSAANVLTRSGRDASLEAIKSLLEEKATEQAKRRQAKIDLDRKFRTLEESDRGKGVQVANSMLRDGLLSFHGYLKILSGMSAKQVADTAGRVVESAVDLARTRSAQLFGRETPRTSTAASIGPAGVNYTVRYLAREAVRNISSAAMGKSSNLMPAHSGPTGNPYADAALAPMQRLYASKEAIFRSWAFPQERFNQATVLAKNDQMDGVIKRGQFSERRSDYLNGRAEFEGPRNKQYAESMARQAANYEVRNKEIIPSLEAGRAKELAASPKELIDSLARQYADQQVYAEPSRVSQVVSGVRGQFGRITGTGGSATLDIAQSTVLPFVKRPSNAIIDTIYTYTGARIPVEALRNTLGRGWGPAEIRSFNQAVARGGEGAGLFAVGMALGARGLITPADDGKSRNVKKAAGYQDGAIHAGDHYYSIKGIPFIGWLLVAGATAQQRGFSSVPGAIMTMIEEHPL